MAKNKSPELDPLLDGVTPDVDETTPETSLDQVLASAGNIEEPSAGEAPAAGAAPASGPLAEAAASVGLPVPSELELAERELDEARATLADAEAAAASARAAVAKLSRRVTELRPAPTLEECNRAAARVEAKLAEERAEQEKRERVVFVNRRAIPPLPSAGIA